jgi:hypothetical protein
VGKFNAFTGWLNYMCEEMHYPPATNLHIVKKSQSSTEETTSSNFTDDIFYLNRQDAFFGKNFK